MVASIKNSNHQDTEPVGCQQQLGFRKGMVIASLNVNDLRGHFDEVKVLLNDLGIHILAFNEVKIDKLVPKELNDITGFQQQRLDRTRNGGGVSLHSRDSVRFMPRDDLPVEGFELICVKDSPPKGKRFLIIA